MIVRPARTVAYRLNGFITFSFRTLLTLYLYTLPNQLVHSLFKVRLKGPCNHHIKGYLSFLVWGPQPPLLYFIIAFTKTIG